MSAASDQWSCDLHGGKRIYTSPQAAEFALARIRKLQEAGNTDRHETHSYLCPISLDHWHLTSLAETYNGRVLQAADIELAVTTLRRGFDRRRILAPVRQQPVPVPPPPVVTVTPAPKGTAQTPPSRIKGPVGPGEWTSEQLGLLFQGLCTEEVAQAAGRSIGAVMRKSLQLLAAGQWVDVTDIPGVVKFREAAARDCDPTPAERAYLDGAGVMTEPDDLLTVKEAAELAGTPKQYVNALVKQGRLTRYLRSTTRKPGGQVHVSRAQVLAWRQQLVRRPSGGISPGDGDPRHGTVNGANNLECHCSECRAAWAAEVARRRAMPRTLPPGDPRHGTQTARRYWHCTCDICRPPKPEKLYPKPIPEDWLTIGQVAELLGITRQRVYQLQNDDRLWPFTTVGSRTYYLRSEVENIPPARAAYKGRLGRRKETNTGVLERPAEAMTIARAANWLGVSETYVRRHFGRFLIGAWVKRADVYAHQRPRRRAPKRDMKAEGFLTVGEVARRLRVTRFRAQELFPLHYASEGSKTPWVDPADLAAYRPPTPPPMTDTPTVSELLAAARARRVYRG